ncbi:MAG: phosphoribosylformylglycinamidine synthase subunit PurS [Candidatus Saccharimonadales bacterium]
MTKYQLLFEIYPKEGMPDPQSVGELKKVKALFQETKIEELRIAKLIGLTVEAASPDEVDTIAHKLADDILVQPVLEDYHVRSITEID